MQRIWGWRTDDDYRAGDFAVQLSSCRGEAAWLPVQFIWGGGTDDGHHEDASTQPCSGSREAVWLPAEFVWGGRTDEGYLEDGWLFHVGNSTWQEVPAVPSVHQPQGRDHMGAFYWQGAVYLYGAPRGRPWALLQCCCAPCRAAWLSSACAHRSCQLSDAVVGNRKLLSPALRAGHLLQPSQEKTFHI